ncbi:MAG: acetyl-CoA carboxylase biotin carboxyl carrier protein subunit, partial [Candidatus Eremiobacterota bacterium]
PTTFHGEVESSMPGTVLQLRVEPGDAVQAGDPLVVMESMKMEMTVEAPAAGTVREVCCGQGDMVAVGQVLVRLDVA